jgi:ribosomal protein L27
MANPRKAKGDRAEREVCKRLSELLGRKVERKLGAGRRDDTGDVAGLPNCVGQVKNYDDTLRAIREGLADIEVQRLNAGVDHSVILIRQRGGRWIAVQTVESWAALFATTL